MGFLRANYYFKPLFDFFLELAKVFDSGTIAEPHTDYVCAWSEHSIALSHVSSVHSQRDCSRRLECTLGHSFLVAVCGLLK